MSDAKALRYANGLRQYCNERPCKDGECVFLLKVSGICPLKEGRLPEDWKLEGLGQEVRKDER
jgi:hypothetical protein